MLIAEAIASGEDPDQLEEPVWEWVDPLCDPSISDCGFGLSDPPVFSTSVEDPTPETLVYEDCSDSTDDPDCVEHWSIQCESLQDVDCLTSVV